MTDLLEAIAGLDSSVIYLVVFGLALAETAILADMFVPGEVGLVVAAAAGAHADLPVAQLWLCAAAGATCGDTISYLVGRKLGTRAAESRWMRRHAGAAVERSLRFIERRGGGAVFVGRWIGALRAMVPFVAGTARMPGWRFAAWNVVASLCWAGVVVWLGYRFGRGAAEQVDRYRWAVLAVGATVLVGWVVLARRKRPVGSTAVTSPLVDAAWVCENKPLLADVRFYLDGRSARAAYDAGHIPGAVFVDLERDLAAPTGPGRHPLPSPEDFAAAMARLGIGDTTPVVAYDDAGGSIAARLWWMLDAQGQTAYVLDGGLDAWDGPLETDPVEPTPVDRPIPARPWPRVTDADGAAGAATLLDARAAERYRGEVEPIDPRKGHVPGAHSAPWAENLDPATGRFKPPAELAERYRALHVDDAPVVYCGSGVTACHDLLALRHAGLPDGVLYEGSWSDWSADPARPVRTGPVP